MAKKGEHFHLKEGGLIGSVAEVVIRKSGKPFWSPRNPIVKSKAWGWPTTAARPRKKRWRFLSLPKKPSGRSPSDRPCRAAKAADLSARG